MLVWKRITSRQWVPCDEVPQLVVPGEGKMRTVRYNDWVEGCALGNHGKAVYAFIPHIYTCPALRHKP
jgi:hypothetical protein